MFENLIAALKADKRKIVFTEGPDARILEAAARLKFRDAARASIGSNMPAKSLELKHLPFGK